MTLPQSILVDGPWPNVALVQVTLIALLGVLAWLAVRRCGPALRGAVLLAALVGLAVVPALATVAPVWVPLPECLCPAGARPAPADAGDAVAAPPPPLVADSTVYVLVTQPPTEPPPDPAGPGDLAGQKILRPANETTRSPVKAEAVVLTVSYPPDEAAPPKRPAEVPRPSWPLAGVLAALWLLGAVALCTRALVRLALLYRCARRACPVRENEWTDCMESLAKRYGLPAVALRESPAIASPLTLGILRPMILLPLGRRHWSAEERALILGHELAHVRRRDFLTGLVAELAACLCWFHPLVRWLVGRLRLEQEYAADAWVASAMPDAMDYVRCLARLALELSRGRSSPAPAFWRRRSEILRRIDMLRHTPHGTPPYLGKRATWMVALLAAAACLAVAGVGPLHSAPDDPGPAAAGPEVPSQAATDSHGDPLPDGALARLGTMRLRHGADITFVAFAADGKTLITAGEDDTIRVWEIATGKEIRRFARPRPAEPKPPKEGDKAAPKNKVKGEAVLRLMTQGVGDAGNFSVALAPDGKTLAAANGQVIQLWDVGTGKAIRQIEGPSTGLSGLLFSPDGKRLAARSPDNTFYLWAADTGKEIHQIKPPPRKATNEIVLTFGGDGNDAPGMAFSPDGKTLAAATTRFDQQGGNSSAITFWDVASGKETQQIKVPQGVDVSAVAFAPDGKVLAFGGGGVVHLCAADTGKEIRQLKVRGGVLALAFAPDGKTLAVGGRNQRVRLWETETGKELHHLGDAEPARSGGLALVSALGFAAPEARALAFSPDGKRIAAAAGSTVRLWEAATGKELPLLDGHREAPSAIIVSPDGKTVVSWGDDRVIRRWDAATGKPLGAFPAPPRTTLAAFSADGRAVALANADNTIRIHETATGKELHRLKGHSGGLAALAFAPDGKVLASRGSADHTIRLYDVAQGAELRQIIMRSANNQGGGTVLIIGGSARRSRPSGAGLAFSPDGKLLVAPGPHAGRSGNTLVVVDVATGKELRKIESPKAIRSFAFSPDGRALATENGDRTLTLWEVASGKERARLGKPFVEQQQSGAGMMAFTLVVDGDFGGGISDPAGPTTLAFAPNGRVLAVRGPDRSVRVWDVAAGKEIGRRKGHEGAVQTVAFAPDGRTLASGGSDTTILLWDAARLMKDLAKPPAVELPDDALESVWGDLGGADAAKALRGITQIAGAPGQAVPFLGERLKPAARVDPRDIDRWINDLESEKFAVRQEATANLVKIGGEQAVPALQKVLKSSPPLETRKRVEELLDRLTGGTLSTEQLRLVRAVEALERMGTPEARRLLRTLAEGAPGALPTREAQAALDRMGGR
jgi:WD40 repeat protein/beta-lactamase regulating signal transducer with metallopeptidase domain